MALGRVEEREDEGAIRINEWSTATGEKRTGLSMAEWLDLPSLAGQRPVELSGQPAPTARALSV
jgi:hypothetical protein